MTAASKERVTAEVSMVSIILTYEDALRLSYMARFPHPKRPEDEHIGDVIDEAIGDAENVAFPQEPKHWSRS